MNVISLLLTLLIAVPVGIISACRQNSLLDKSVTVLVFLGFAMTLNKLAEKLYALAAKRQMLLITHWPQLAARARRHFQIVKMVREGETFTLCAPLDKKARHEELARMPPNLLRHL
jgi:ATPase involved in DNA repair